MKPMIRKHHTKLWLTLIMLFSVLFGLYLSKAPVFESTEEGALDIFFKWRTRPVVEKVPGVAIVMVDEAALKADYGYFDPLPRRYLARLIDTLSAKGAKVIAMDIAFYDKMDKLDPGGDTVLLNAMKRADNVIAVSIWHDREDGSYMQNPDSFFLGGLKGVGYANLQVSGGGMMANVREVKPVATLSDGETYLSFSAMAYSMYQGIKPEALIEDLRDGKNQIIKNLPLYHRGSMIINYIGPPARWQKQSGDEWIQVSEGNFLTYRSSRLTGEIAWPEDFFKNKVVFIGNGGEFVPDRFITPYYVDTKGNWMYGAEVHANAFMTLMNQNFISKIPFGILLILLIILPVLVVQVTVRYGLLVELLCVILLLIAIWTSGYILFAGYNLWLPVLSLTFTVIVSYFATSIYQAFTEEKNKKQIKSMFTRYAPPAYVEELVKDPTKLELGGEEKEISILFSDIEGFTTISENLGPKKLVELLNEYLGAMTKVIFNQGGTLDKYIGDAIVAVFGAPLAQKDHALNACLAALEMQQHLKGLREQWIKKGLPPIKNRIGVNTGKVVFGNIGSDIRYDYTGIGDAMNLSSRLEGANKQYGTYLMISEFTYEQAREHLIVRDLDFIIVKGKTKPVKVFELIARKSDTLPEAQIRMIEMYQQGIELYRKQEWLPAINKFEEALGFVPDDCPSKLYIERCKEFIANPPGANWDGTYHMTTK